jgi:tetratricopeptide (TPR) repeat protein
MQHWDRIEQLFAQLAEAPADQRARLLDELKSRDPTLRAELVALLREHDGVGPLDAPPPAIEAAADGELLDAGAMLGPWRIDSLIGSGGSGDVYSAMRADGAFEQRVAIKVMRRVAATDIDRFRSERQILARLDHPGIARILDGGVCVDQRLYTVMEFVEGQPLDLHCQSHGVDLRGRLQLFLQICAAAEYAHQNLVVHRDFKPANILVNDAGRVRLVDFGIAKLLAGDEASRPEAAIMPLTPAYAAPEQLAGEPVTTATDVYALGVVLHELLTGARPAPGAIAVGKLRGDLDAIVMKCLQVSPQDRYGAVAALKRDIESFLSGEPVQARPLSLPRRALKFVARRKLLSAAAAAAVSAIVIAGAVALWQAKIARQQRDSAQALADRNLAVREFLSVVITAAPRAGRPVTVEQLLERSQRFAEGAFAQNPEHQAAALGMLASNYYVFGNIDSARSLFERAHALLGSSADQSLRAEITCDYAQLLGRNGESDRAKAMVAQVLSDRSALTPQAEASCLHALASMAQYSGDGNSVVEHASAALERWRAGAFRSPMLEARLLGSLAAGYNLKEETAASDRHYAMALAKLDELGLERSPEAHTLINNWGVLVRAMGDERRALDLYDRLLQIQATDDPDSPPSPGLQANRATTLEMLGRPVEARAAYESALAAALQMKNDGPAAHSLLGLARIANSSGDLDAAERYLARAADYEKRVATAGSSVANAIDLEAANIALARGHRDRARSGFSRIIVDQTIRAGYRIVALRGRAQMFLEEGDLAAAHADAAQALAIAQSLQRPLQYSARIGNSWLMLGRVLQRQGKQNEAQAAFRNAVVHLGKTVDAAHPSLIAAQELAQAPQ